MRKIVAAAFVSLDGVMQAPGGPQEDPEGGFALGGWTVPFWQAEGAETLGAFMEEMFAPPFDLLLGRRTYEIFAAHWPFVGPEEPIGALFTSATKYVATGSTAPLGWANSVPLDGDIAAAVARLKQQEGPRLLTQGSSRLLQALLAHDLVDEFRLLVFPVILGQGKRLFSAGAMPRALALRRTETSSSGVIMSVYERAGAVRTGSFALAEPSEAEAARRQEQARGG
ncbi:dihydrofolate reductase family protein [Teichococcus oryzae]|uniref:Dihydrofolate reductase family protein n=1 Tax=Teichococcus oryzae TaxID=1608942 RepID=A0A5B2TJE9_9PROT|nr:dihydrofolate reductase family protein [Pseudoroseomonas oryzae]KAA2214622.1 dihydrofolate reductase family protein [Pseudoroseomonas oryzae]